MEAALQKGVVSAMQNTERTVAINLCSVCRSEYPPELEICPRDGAKLMPLAQELLVGTLLNDRYSIESIIGQGSMGVVYRATHKTIGRPVAIKMLNWRLVSNPRSIKRFEREAQATSRLNHANVVAVHDVGLAPTRQPYIVMDFAEGVSLGEKLKTGERFSIPRAINIFLQICAALNHAHEKGVIHRDLKPSNIILNQDTTGDDHVKVVDFGVAKLAHPDGEETDHLTKTGEVIGTPAYMSPEQCMSRPLDARSDVYSLGIVMYHVLAGKPPLLGMNTLETMGKQVMEMPARFNAVPCTDVPAELEEIVFQCLAKFPQERYQTMADLYVDLQAIARSLSSNLQPRRQVPLPPRSQMPERADQEMQALVGILERQRQRYSGPPAFDSDGFDCSPEPAGRNLANPNSHSANQYSHSANQYSHSANQSRSGANYSAIRAESRGLGNGEAGEGEVVHRSTRQAGREFRRYDSRGSHSSDDYVSDGSDRSANNLRKAMIASLAVLLAATVSAGAFFAWKSVSQSAISEQVDSEVDKIWNAENSAPRTFNANIPQAAIGIQKKSSSVATSKVRKPGAAPAAPASGNFAKATQIHGGSIQPKGGAAEPKGASAEPNGASAEPNRSMAFAQSTFQNWFNAGMKQKNTAKLSEAARPDTDKSVVPIANNQPAANMQTTNIQATANIQATDPIHSIYSPVHGAKSIASQAAKSNQNFDDNGAALSTASHSPSDRETLVSTSGSAPAPNAAVSANSSSSSHTHSAASTASLVDLNNQGVAAMNARNYPAAIRHFEEALKIDPHYRKAVVNLCNTFNNYATTLHEENRMIEAEAMYKRALSLREREFGIDSRDLIPTLDNYSALLHALYRENEAKKIEARIVALRGR